MYRIKERINEFVKLNYKYIYIYEIWFIFKSIEFKVRLNDLKSLFE